MVCRLAVQRTRIRPYVRWTTALVAAGAAALAACKSLESDGGAGTAADGGSAVLDDAAFVPLATAETLLVISDLDDTLQIANTADARQLPKLVKAQRAFPGMPMLLRVLARKAEGRAYVVGVRPPAQVAQAPAFLKKVGLGSIVDAKQATIYAEGSKPEASLNPKPDDEPTGLPSDPTYDLKKARLEAIVDRYVPSIALTSVAPAITRLVLIGDQSDADVYEHVLDRYGERVRVEIYLRRVVDTTLIPRGLTTFHNALEVALGEYEAGMITADEAAAVGRAVLYKACESDEKCHASEGDGEVADADLLPEFHSCPGALEPGGDLPEELEVLRARIAERLQSLCDLRKPPTTWQEVPEDESAL